MLYPCNDGWNEGEAIKAFFVAANNKNNAFKTKNMMQLLETSY